MAVLLFQKRFVEPITSGRKKQTIRPPRKRPLIVGDYLSLRYWRDKPYRSPQVEFASVRCTGIFDIQVRREGILIGGYKMHGPARDNFARGDGFANWPEMREFFKSRFGYGLPFIGTLIKWEDR